MANIPSVYSPARMLDRQIGKQDLDSLIATLTVDLPDYPIFFRDGKTFHANLILEALEALLNYQLSGSKALKTFWVFADFNSTPKYPTTDNDDIDRASVEFLTLIKDIRFEVASIIADAKFENDVKKSLQSSAELDELISKLRSYEQAAFEKVYIDEIRKDLKPILQNFPTYPIAFIEDDKTMTANLVNEIARKISSFPFSQASADYVSYVISKISFIDEIPDNVKPNDPSVDFLMLVEKIKLGLAKIINNTKFPDSHSQMIELDDNVKSLLIELRTNYMDLRVKDLARPSKVPEGVDLNPIDDDEAKRIALEHLMSDPEAGRKDVVVDITEQNLRAAKTPPGIDLTSDLPRPVRHLD